MLKLLSSSKVIGFGSDKAKSKAWIRMSLDIVPKSWVSALIAVVKFFWHKIKFRHLWISVSIIRGFAQANVLSFLAAFCFRNLKFYWIFRSLIYVLMFVWNFVCVYWWIICSHAIFWSITKMRTDRCLVLYLKMASIM